MITVKNFKLDVTTQFREPIILVQYEVDARVLEIQLTAGILPIDLTGASVVFYAKKSDGTILFNNCEIVDSAMGKVVYTATEQTCAVAGPLRCWILVIKGTEELRSLEFTVTVQPSEDDTSAIESTSEFTALETALALVSDHEARIASTEGDIDILQARANGWIDPAESWVYASPTTITVPSGAAAKYQKGDKIKLTQTTVKYFYILGVADTLLTITGGTDYTLTNETITANYYSHSENPVGFPGWFTWSPTYTGFSTPQIATHKFRIDGGKVFINIDVQSFGVSNATNFLISAPVPISGYFSGTIAGHDNSTNILDTYANSSSGISLRKNNAGTNTWTASGNKGAYMAGYYMMA